ncbi:hypothetical protein [Sporosarcina ureilytica]|uniref:Zinc-finger domain-containing protein n=1 Tax=Sporosarcina ureilytica TaxID=298596 RepID=A0A1D8JH10_9BACL|nr:hypothetical protein [Sporosarcina ureilytica]AOV07986.1 hypothetical protein BI350_10865 [Sporosarcina ureilytica]
MNHDQKIHLLAQELIPVINDLDNEPKKIILDHMKDCAACKDLYSNTLEFEENMPALNPPDDIEVKPLKKLVQFNTGLKLLLVAIRGLILFYILYTSIRFSGTDLIDLSFVQPAIFLFYTPAVIFLLIFTFTFFNKKWLWGSLVTDLFIILFLGKVLQFFF